jgi:methyl coenzyme M reductase subunit C
MSMCMRTLILGAAIGIAPAVTTISPAHAGVIGPGKLHITEPASLAELVRGRMGSGASRVSTVRSGSGVAQGGTASIWPGSDTRVDSRSLNLKAAQVPGRRVIYSPSVEKPYTVRRGDTLSSIAVSPSSAGGRTAISRHSTGIKETVHLPIYDAIDVRAKPRAR